MVKPQMKTTMLISLFTFWFVTFFFVGENHWKWNKKIIQVTFFFYSFTIDLIQFICTYYFIAIVHLLIILYLHWRYVAQQHNICCKNLRKDSLFLFLFFK